MSPSALSLCTNGVLKSALKCAASAPSGRRVEASATSSSNDRNFGFSDRGPTAPAAAEDVDVSCAAHGENTIPIVSMVYKVIVAAAPFFTGAPSNIPLRLCVSVCVHAD